MKRRDILKGGLAVIFFANAGTTAAHTPYKQWQVYRKKHLLIGCLKDNPETYTLAKSLVALFADELPRASARVARAPHLHRVASLMATNQLDTCIMPASMVVELAAGSGEFSPYGPVSLRVLFKFDDLLFVGLKSMPEHHAQMVYQALLSKYPADKKAQLAIPWHIGIADHEG